MGEKIKFEKTVFVRDSNGVTRQAFLAGESIDSYILKMIFKTETIVNPDDLPDEAKELQEAYTKPEESKMENKMLPKDEQEDSGQLKTGEDTANIKESEPVVKHKPKTKVKE